MDKIAIVDCKTGKTVVRERTPEEQREVDKFRNSPDMKRLQAIEKLAQQEQTETELKIQQLMETE